MPLADLDDYVARLGENRVADFQMSSTFGVAARLCNGWRLFVPAPAVPGASVALDASSAHAIGPLPAPGGGRLTLMGARLNPSLTSGQAVILVDLLNVSGGLSGSVTGAQAGATAALTRHTDGAGVMGGILITSQIGSTATTFTVAYTNQDGAAATSPPAPIGGTGLREGGRVIPIPLAEGDTGMRAIASVTLAASTAGAGSIGFCLWKPLAMIACNDVGGAHAIDAVSTGGFVGALAEVPPDACLSVMGIGAVSQALSGAVILAEV